MNFNESQATILSFPINKAQDRELEIPTLELDEFIVENEYALSQETSSEKEQKALDAFLDRTLKDFHLPPFVIKMRKVSSINEQIDQIKRMSRELDYYLNEIEIYQSKKK